MENFIVDTYFTIALIISGIVMIIGSITDLKKREVPDWVNYGFFFTAIGLRLIYTLAQGGKITLFDGIAGFLVATVFALTMFYTGQWGGGDSKMLIGLGTILGVNVIPFSWSIATKSFFISFLINILIVGALYGLIWSIVLVIINRKQFLLRWNEQIKYMIKYLAIGFVVIVVGTTVAIILKDPIIFILGILPLTFMLLIMFTKSIEHGFMRKIIPVSELTEGDWIEKEVSVKGKYICGPKDLGISKEQIAKLKKLKVQNIGIKIGIPFVPSFLLAFIATLLWGNLINIFISLFMSLL